MSDTSTQGNTRAAALRYLADRAIQYLLQVGEPVKTGQITGFISDEHPVSAKVVRDALTLDSRFVQSERRWNLAARDLNPHHPLERSLEDLLLAVGHALTVDTLSVEIARATGQPVEIGSETVRRLVTLRPRFVLLDGDRAVPVEWLLDISADHPEDVLFENFDEGEEATRFRDIIATEEWVDPAGAARKLLQAVKEPVSGKAMAFLAYEADGEGFDPARFHQALLDSDLVRLSDGRWVNAEIIATFGACWEAIADEPPVEGAPEEGSRAGGLVEITPADMEEIEQMIRRVEGLLTSRRVLEEVLEVNAGDADYAAWESALADALQNQGDLIHVGWDRWRKPESMPVHVLDAPESLNLQDYSFHTMEGEETDPILSEEGLEGSLKEQVKTPLAMMGGECVTQDNGTAICTATILHHASGTLPVGGENPFFPADPPLLEATVHGPDGKFTLWVNNILGLAFGLDELYASLPESGGVFTLAPMNRPGEFRLEVRDEQDPRIGLDEARVKELTAIAKRPQYDDTSTFDLIGELLEKHRKGADFFTLLAELWVMRPVTAHQVASILSVYYCFKQNKNGTWSFDPREVDKGTKKAKRKYIL